MKRKVWVIADSPKEADEIARDGFGFESGALANEALRQIHRTADPYYANRLRVYVRRQCGEEVAMEEKRA